MSLPSDDPVTPDSMTMDRDFAPSDSHEMPLTTSSPTAQLSPILSISNSGNSLQTYQSLQASQNLRKSISVDSFVQYGKEPQVGNRPNRVNTTTALEPPRGLGYAISSAYRRERPELSLNRNRGQSVSSVREDYNSLNISDSERSDCVTSPIDGYNRVMRVKAGELPLPSRTPNLSTSSSLNSSLTSSSSSSHTQEGMLRMQSTSSLQSPPTRSVAAGRSRSGSLGVYAPNPPRRIAINTQVSPKPDHGPITLIVVGVTGCGKSVLIRKGLKGYGLSDQSASLPGVHSNTRYTRRTGKIAENDGNPSTSLNIIEVGITPSDDAVIATVGFLPETPNIDGVIICYDCSNAASFKPVKGLLQGYHNIQLPTVVLACKSDLEHQIDPQSALEILQRYDVGLVEVSSTTDTGKDKIKRSFTWILNAVSRERRPDKSSLHHNPASPGILQPNPFDSRTTTPTPLSASSPPASALPPIPPQPVPRLSQVVTSPTHRNSVTPSSPTRVRSTGDLLSEFTWTRDGQTESENPHSRPSLQRHSSADSLHVTSPITNGNGINGANGQDERKEPKEKDQRAAQWATIDELLDKLLFLAVSGDDPTYITHFLLTYRRFASPRSVLLAMQKRMRQLDNPTGDPMFACFAQMRICHLLEIWIHDYPYDFAVRGTAGALSALIKSIISKTYLLHYGSDFLPFLELLPSQEDRDSSWALKLEDPSDESDDSWSLLEEEEESIHRKDSAKAKLPLSPNSSRDRKLSQTAVAAKAFGIISSSSTLSSTSGETVDMDPKKLIKELQKLSQDLNVTDSSQIAEEITRIEAGLFLNIEPRHWLQYTFVSGKKDPDTDPITRFNNVSNHLAAWVVSLILCHDRPRARARQIEKFVDIAQKLRSLNNYSALRAFVAGINSSTFAGDQTMEQFKTKSPEQAKILQSWDVLLQHIRSHRAYRMALRNTKGACIPALEVHMSDLIRSHEGNPDFNSSEPDKIHWGKFNMMGRFISSTTQCQAQCRNTSDYDFPDRKFIRHMLFPSYIMSDEMQTSRMAPQEGDAEEYGAIARLPSANQPRDVAILRRLFFW